MIILNKSIMQMKIVLGRPIVFFGFLYSFPSVESSMNFKQEPIRPAGHQLSILGAFCGSPHLFLEAQFVVLLDFPFTIYAYGTKDPSQYIPFENKKEWFRLLMLQPITLNH